MDTTESEVDARMWARWSAPEASTLSRRMGLDVWGVSLLSSAAAAQLHTAALALLVVTTFEFVAWFVFFNTVLLGDPLQIGGASIGAGLMAALCATGIFLFERAIVTADLTNPQARLAALGRVLVILGSSFATAQPIEILVFGAEIQARRAEEEQIGRALTRLQDLDADVESDPSVVQAIEQLATAETAVTNARTGANDARGARDRACAAADAAARQEKDRREALAHLARAAVPADPAERARYDSAVLLASNRVSSASAYATTTSQACAGATGTESSTTQSVEQLEADRKAAQDRVEARRTEARQRQEQELTRIREEVELATPGPAGFLERLRVLDDLRTGRGPAIPTLSDAEQTVFEQIRPGSTVLSNAETWERRAQTFTWAYLGSYLVALLFPGLALLTKLTAGRDLALYFSLRAQALNGEPSARRILAIDDRLVDASRRHGLSPG